MSGGFWFSRIPNPSNSFSITFLCVMLYRRGHRGNGGGNGGVSVLNLLINLSSCTRNLPGEGGVL